MSIPVLTILIFIVTVALVISGFYFLIYSPAEKRKLRQRIELAKADVSALSVMDSDNKLLRSEVLSRFPLVHRLLLSLPGIQNLQLFVQQSAANVTVGMLLTLSLILGWFVFLVALLFGIIIFLAAFFGLLAAAMPFIVIAIMRQRRFLRFEEQFPDAIDLLGRAVRAGHAFTTGLELIAKEMPAPLSEEFQRTYEQQNLGLPLRDAFENLMRRVPLTDVRIFVTALMIQRESGGNLAEILDNLSSVIRERFKLMRQIRVFTAQGRMSLYVLVSVPPAMGVMIYLFQREYIMRLFTDPLGIKFLITGIVLQVIGFFVIRKITQPKF
ncbi:MAG TPA: type II secretion system F family protein [Acidobacteriota bacterium]|nr:type II secretion system F family protein [Acidobacteriota bacterium]